MSMIGYNVCFSKYTNQEILINEIYHMVRYKYLLLINLYWSDI